MKHKSLIQFFCLFALGHAAVGCAPKTATVLPKGPHQYDIIATGPTEGKAFTNAESQANETCDDEDKTLNVVKQDSVYQGADKNSRDDVEGENVALAFFTGKTGKERAADDYKVTLNIKCQ